MEVVVSLDWRSRQWASEVCKAFFFWDKSAWDFSNNILEMFSSEL